MESQASISPAPPKAARRRWPLFWAAAAVVYVLGRLWMDMGGADPNAAGNVQVRNQVLLLCDEINNQRRLGKSLDEAFHLATEEARRSPSMAEYSYYLSASEERFQAHGPRSAMRFEEGLRFADERAPLPEYDILGGRYRLLAVRRLGEGRRAEVWQVDQDRNFSVDAYWLALPEN